MVRLHVPSSCFTLMDRMGSEPYWSITIGATINFDGDSDSDGTCKRTFAEIKHSQRENLKTFDFFSDVLNNLF